MSEAAGVADAFIWCIEKQRGWQRMRLTAHPARLSLRRGLFPGWTRRTNVDNRRERRRRLRRSEKR